MEGTGVVYNLKMSVLPECSFQVIYVVLFLSGIISLQVSRLPK